MICSFVEHGDPPLGFVLLARTWVLSLFVPSILFPPSWGALFNESLRHLHSLKDFEGAFFLFKKKNFHKSNIAIFL